MALLSEETTLFKELNLVKSSSSISVEPKDFYSFLLYKITSMFETFVKKNILIDYKTKGSYERLSKFVWDSYG